MEPSREKLEAARDAALRCGRAVGRFLQDYCQPLQYGLPGDDPLTLRHRATHDMRELRTALDAFAENVTQVVVRWILIANAQKHDKPIFDGYQFPTFHEVAGAAAEMTLVTLGLLAEDLPQAESDPERLAASLRNELLDYQREYGDLRSDRLVSCIEEESAMAIRHLAESSLPNRPHVGAAPNSPVAAPIGSVRTRDPELEARDAGIYELAMKGVPWPEIVKSTAGTAGGIWSRSGAKRAADEFARRRGLDRPPRRRPGRPKKR
jgi:hypothetical protein